MNLMHISYDKRKNTMCWNDIHGNVMNIEDLVDGRGNVTHLGTDLKYTSEIYIFALEATHMTKRPYDIIFGGEERNTAHSFYQIWNDKTYAKGEFRHNDIERPGGWSIYLS